MFYRSDNRASDQMRPVNIVPGYIHTAEGSCAHRGRQHSRDLHRLRRRNPFLNSCATAVSGWITHEYSMLPRATLTRTPREVSKGRSSGRTHEIQRLIGRSLRAATDLVYG